MNLFKASKSDKPYIIKWVIGCSLVILLFHFAWAKYLFQNLGNPVFTLIDGAVLGFFIAESAGAIKRADDPNKDWKRYAFIAAAAFLCFWAGIWSTSLMENVASGF